jgi:hypothetical protein
MRRIDLDQLAAALQASVDLAQLRLDRAQGARLERQLTLAEDGHPDGTSWRCVIEPGAEGNDRRLVLPLLSLHALRPYQVTRATIAFEAEAQERTGVAAGSDGPVHVLLPQRRRRISWFERVLNFLVGRRRVQVGILVSGEPDDAGSLRRRLATRVLNIPRRRTPRG